MEVFIIGAGGISGGRAIIMCAVPMSGQQRETEKVVCCAGTGKRQEVFATRPGFL